MNNLTHHEAGALLYSVGKSMMMLDLCAGAALDEPGAPWVASEMALNGVDLERALEIVAIPDVLEVAISVINLSLDYTA